MNEPLLSEGTQSYRVLMWVLLVLAILALGLAFAGLRSWFPRSTVPFSMLIFSGAVLGSSWFGLQGHRRALADRERASRSAMMLVIAAQLGRQETPMLEKIAAKGGPAAEAARMILDGRRRTRTTGAARTGVFRT